MRAAAFSYLGFTRMRKTKGRAEFHSKAPFCHSKTNPIVYTTKNKTKLTNPACPVETPPKTQGSRKATSRSKT